MAEEDDQGLVHDHAVETANAGRDRAIDAQDLRIAERETTKVETVGPEDTNYQEMRSYEWSLYDLDLSNAIL